eukprot:RCo000610
MRELILAVQEGKVSLRPFRDSGWYSHCLYALEPLLVPEKTEEAPKLSLSRKYRKELENLFKAMFSLTRETHSQDIGWMVAACADWSRILKLFPRLTVEPLATYYGRRGDAYEFVREVLLAH